MTTIQRPPPRRKRLGQHFLHDAGVIHRIVSAIQPGAGAPLIEIGPGRGALTRALLATGHKLSVIEVDRDLVAHLQRELGASGTLNVYEADALEFDFCSFGSPVRVIGNLPYNISTPLLFRLLDQLQCIEQMLFMLQKEVVDRICAAPGGREYGRLTVMVQARCAVERLFKVGAGAFQPPPRVESAVVRLMPRPEYSQAITDPVLFADLVRGAFQQRRKMLRNALRAVVPDPGPLLEQQHLDGAARPETLTVAQYIALANAVVELKAASAGG